MAEVEPTIAALLEERPVFEPPEGFRARAIVRDRRIYEQAEADREGFWTEQAEVVERIHEMVESGAGSEE